MNYSPVQALLRNQSGSLLTNLIRKEALNLYQAFQRLI
jgi:hypothetical protein